MGKAQNILTAPRKSTNKLPNYSFKQKNPKKPKTQLKPKKPAGWAFKKTGFFWTLMVEGQFLGGPDKSFCWSELVTSLYTGLPATDSF